MTSVEELSNTVQLEHTKDSGSTKAKKNTSKSQNGGSNRHRERENRPPIKDRAPRPDADVQNALDDDDESDMVPPDPVPEPSSEEQNARVEAIRAEIDAMEQKVVM
jgi:hypothetical protein